MGLCASAEAAGLENQTPVISSNSVIRVAKAEAPARPLTPHERLALYTISKETLGTGATSDVFRGTRNADHRPVAVKVLNKLTTDAHRQENLEEDIKGARTEAELMESLNGHPHVAEIFDFIETGSKLHTFIELVPGGELYDQLKLEPYTEGEAREHFRQMLEGINHTHSKGIVHRDIKPENILMTEPTRSAKLKIVDYGFADRVPEGLLYERLGTPKYVAPEIWSADERRGRGYGTVSDMYAFGLILHQMLTGMEAFDYYKPTWEVDFPPRGRVDPDDDRAHEFAQWCATEPALKAWTDTVSEEESMLGPEARDIVSKLLHRNPAERITAKEALEHPWFASAARSVPLTKAAEGIRSYQARKRLLKGMRAVLFTARVKGMVGKLRKGISVESGAATPASEAAQDDPATPGAAAASPSSHE